MSLKSRLILDSMKSMSQRDGLPAEVFAEFILPDDPFRSQILGDDNGQ